jgi:putative CocE/NonD family hydrolase
MARMRIRPAGRGKRWFGKKLLAFLLLVAFGTAALLVLASRVKLAGEEITPSGLRRNYSLYVTMRDGIRLAVDVWLPADYHTGEHLPVLMRSTRYWRAIQPHLELRLRVLLHLTPPDILFSEQDQYFSQRRFVLLVSDMRGSGASEGERYSEYSPDEIADLGDLAAWAASQPWSNGHIGSYGSSYEGNTAELTAVSGIPAVRAEAPLYNDFDTLAGFARPGGVLNRGMMDPWSQWVYSLDRNVLCRLSDPKGWRCWVHRLLQHGVKHTDDDRDGRQLKAILSHRENPTAVQSLGASEFRDDMFATSKGPMNLARITPYGLRPQIEASKVPMMVWCGWMDAATSDGALNRYRNFSNQQVVILGAFTHGGGHGTDPLLGNVDPPNPPREEQWRIQADFFDGILRSEAPAKIESHIDYYTMGEGRWHSTTVWPPAGLQTQRLYFAADRKLEITAPSTEEAADRYRVDYWATSGKQSRWLTQLGGMYVNYGNRSGEDSKLLTYTGDSLPSDTEITGSPVLTVELSSSATDGAIHAYLEDVAPDGRVTYLTEGIIRLINRKMTQAPLPYEPLGPRHSYLRSDAAPMTADKPERVEFGMFATSVLLRKSHRIRVALAGADSDNFELIPGGDPPRWTVYRDREKPSFIDLPIKSH